MVTIRATLACCRSILEGFPFGSALVAPMIAAYRPQHELNVALIKAVSHPKSEVVIHLVRQYKGGGRNTSRLDGT